MDNFLKYFNSKITEDFSKPIFVLSHLALNYSMRTYNDGDGQYAKYIFDVINDVKNNEIVFDEFNGVINEEVEGYKYGFVFSPSGLPISLSVEDIDLEIYFKDVSLK